jgi:hypothetical protein
MNKSEHIWNFSTVGGVKRVNLETGNDLLALDTLDQKLWTALSCPVHGLEIDARTLELMDYDHDGRIRVPEILEAVGWITSMVNNADDLIHPEKEFPLAAINQTTEEGKKLYASARQILENLGLSHSPSITVEETSDLAKIFANTKFNGDGIITEDSTDDEALKILLQKMILCCGSATDRTGKQGITLELANQFFEHCENYSAWHAISESNSSVLPFGETTHEAFLAWKSIQPKMDDYFIRCRLAEFDPPAANAWNTLPSQFEMISPKDLSTSMEEIASYPLARIDALKPLPLDRSINPAWEVRLANFLKLVAFSPDATRLTLSEQDWRQISEKFIGYLKWESDKNGTPVEPMGIAYIREVLSTGRKETIHDLIEKDNALKSEAEHMLLVDKLVRYYRDIYSLLKNFVTFYDFYSPDGKAIFQNGTLYLDQRSCDLCFRVNDMAKHNMMVALSGMYLIYCDCVSKSKNEKMTIVAAMTNGDLDNLIVGRNALFYDRNGGDWDATIIKIVENPISIRQAFWSPYRKVARFIETQAEKIASAKEKQVHANGTGHIETVTTKAEETAKAVPPFDVGKFVGIFAAIGLALGAIGGVLASFLSGFLGLIWWKMPIALCGVILAISGPSMIIAWLKLRKRNLAPILDANGWAVNARAIVNIPFGNTLTQLVSLPKNARMNMNDPFTPKKHYLLKVVLVLAILAGIALFYWWRFGNMKTLLQ